MNEKEIWKPIEGEEGYMVSNYGRVKSLNFRRTGNEKLLLQTEHKKQGVLVVNIRGKVCYVHRLVAAAFLNADCNGKIRHKNGNTYDNRSINLRVDENPEKCGERHFEVNTYDFPYDNIVTSNSFLSFAEALTFYEEIDDQYKELCGMDEEGFMEEVCASTF